ncbi:threonine synthase [Candidatus Carsonella ruddii]|uniref:Threonine synthase n=1 Tax=Candidatus Carsonella ruddii PC isolate NHV TaxID=1202540 RepID=J3TER7_CARRU|nr:threonine synthase [Candidatus Carsonella ruddii]AFP84347.1 threonine synthase [Candidatus Carsonella ruddii PC isolate NHV]
MYYNSINNKLNIKSFINIFLNNIPKDKTLFFPFKIPKINKKNFYFLKKQTYIDFAFYISKYFIDYINDENLYKILYNSYLKFNNEVIKLEFLNNNYILNLNSGKTLTFKDIALVPLGFLLNFISKLVNKKIIIFCATSGDTGSAAINSFKNFKNIKLFTFFPFNMISDIQRKQITTIKRNNIHNISLIGNFDSAQFLIKKIFENLKLFKKNFLVSVNSINWFRIILQTIYYCFSSLKLYNNNLINYYVPTGNFGNALSVFIAKKMGFPIGKIIICNNDNYYIDNFLKYEKIHNNNLKKTISPSIDISIPSNFLRIINIYNYKIKNLNKVNKIFYSDKIYNKYIILSLEFFYLKYKKIYDPHTITSLSSLFKENLKFCNVVVSTAYPIKFYFSIKKIIPNLKFNFKTKKIFFLNENYKVFALNFNLIINYIKKKI